MTNSTGRSGIPLKRLRFDFSADFAIVPLAEGNTLAFLNFVDNESGLRYRDFKLVKGKNGPFVVSSQRQTTKAGKTLWVNAVEAVKGNTKGESFFAGILEDAVDAYNKDPRIPQERKVQPPPPSRTRRSLYDD